VVPAGPFDQVVLPHLDAAYNLARWLTRSDVDAEDVVQEACVRALRFFGGFRGDDARSWLLAIVRNSCYDFLRRRRPQELTDAFDEEIHTAWKLSAFIHAQGEAGRDKLTLSLPKPWAGAALWTKQDFEESLGKREDIGLKIVIQEKIKLANYRPPKDARLDRAFLCCQMKGAASFDAALLRRAGYSVATLTLPAGTPLSRYMQFVHYTVCGLGILRHMNFVTQPSVELYKSITGRVYEEAKKSGGVENSRAWQAMVQSPRRATCSSRAPRCRRAR